LKPIEHLALLAGFLFTVYKCFLEDISNMEVFEIQLVRNIFYNAWRILYICLLFAKESVQGYA
jgi:hypothetical protein